MSTRRQTTVTSVSNQLELLAAHTDEEIKALDVYSLRSILRNMGIQDVIREGVTVKLHIARKDELLESVLVLAQRQRDIGRSIIPTEPEQVQAVDLPSPGQIMQRLSFIEHLPPAERPNALSTLAHKVVMALAMAYPDTAEQMRYNTRCKMKSLLMRNTKDLINQSDDLLWLSDSLDTFVKRVNELSSTDSALKKEAGKAKVKAKSTGEQTKAFNLENLESFAVKQLQDLKPGTPRQAWKDVVIALAFVTGRRCNELMCDLTTYEKQDNGLLYAVNLSKGKGDELPDLSDITVLTNIDDVMKALDWVKANNKCINHEEYPSAQAAREAVNKKYAKDLGLHLKKLLIDLEVVEDASDVTFHSLRKMYITKCVQGLPDGRERDEEATRLLGHKDISKASDNYVFDFSIAGV